ncbi:MAG: lipase family protein [Bradymonadia bacterium]
MSMIQHFLRVGIITLILAAMGLAVPAFAQKGKLYNKAKAVKMSKKRKIRANKVSAKHFKALKFLTKDNRLKGLKIVTKRLKKKKKTKPFDAFESIYGKTGLDSWVNAYLFGIASKTAYAPDKNMSYADKKKINIKRWHALGLKLCDINAKYTVKGTTTWDNNVYVLYNQLLVLVVFRGTKEKADFWTDAQALKSTYKMKSVKNGKADLHLGFHDGAVASLWNGEVIKQLARCARLGLPKGQRRSIVFAGHSLGGALAMASAFILTDVNKPYLEVDAVYTYGAPRVGGKSWRARYHKLIPKIRTRRWYRGQDPIPAVPLPVADWPWVGTPQYIKECVGNESGCGKNKIKVVNRDGTPTERASNIPVIDGLMLDLDDHDMSTIAKLIFDEMPSKDRKKLLDKKGKKLKDPYSLVAGIYKTEKFCAANSDCSKAQYCNRYSGHCKPRQAQGTSCLSNDACASNRCGEGLGKGTCSAPHKCQKNGDCKSGQFCNKSGIGANKCQKKKGLNAVCTKGAECQSGRCFGAKGVAGVCANAHKCKSHKSCKKGQYCGSPLTDLSQTKKCRPKGEKWDYCKDSTWCKSNKCLFGLCRPKSLF